jgi:hypothetical protein
MALCGQLASDGQKCVSGWITHGVSQPRDNLVRLVGFDMRHQVVSSDLWSYSISYRVDAEMYADGLLFRVDDTAMPLGDTDALLVSQALDVRVYKAAVGVGWHTFKWIYYKDISASSGRDVAEIFEIGYNGTEFAATECQQCPPGLTSPKGSARCTSCGRGQIWDDEVYRCVTCPVGKYTLPALSTCEQQPPCTADDYVAVYSPCAGGKRDKSYAWMEPKICDSSRGANIPADEVGVPCQACNPGYAQPAGDAAGCQVCDPGTYSPGGGVPCKLCPSGTEARASTFLTEFTTWPRGASTGCSGECGSDGWRLRETFVDAGARHGQAEVWLRFLLVLAEPGKLTFEYDMTCAGDERRFFLDVDHGPPLMLCGGSNQAAAPGAAGQYRAQVSLAAGKHEVRWVYSQRTDDPALGGVARMHRVVIEGVARGDEGVEAGGAHDCNKCKAGYYAGLAWTGDAFSTQTVCQPCPEGQTSVEGSTLCTPCPTDTFAPRPGSPRCLACGANTHSAPGSNGCNQDCLVDLESLGVSSGEGGKDGEGGGAGEGGGEGGEGGGATRHSVGVR